MMKLLILKWHVFFFDWSILYVYAFVDDLRIPSAI